MRRLNRLLKTGAKDESGVIAPLTALLMVALIGMTAFAVDTAMMYSEHAQLQNGADSSALAIAQACAKDPLPPTAPPRRPQRRPLCGRQRPGRRQQRSKRIRQLRRRHRRCHDPGERHRGK